MNSQSFLANFGYIANAPDGVKRLREMILQSAVSGSLVAQIDSEGDVEKDIEQAEILREEYRQRYNIRNKKPIGPLKDEEIPFPIPTNWKWVRMESVACYIQRGKGPRYAKLGRARVVSQKCIQWSGFDLSLARRISDESLETYGEERYLKEGDILWNSTGTGTVGRVGIYPGSQDPVVADSHVTIIRLTNFIPKYVCCYLFSPIIQTRMAPNQEGSMVSGTTNQVELSTSKVSELPVPCPPISEQQRIITKVDELMALCNKLEAQQLERKQRFPILSRAIHTRFAKSPTLANLNAIFDKTGTVSPEDFRKTILSLAVQGKLVVQDPNDEPVEKLLSMINEEKRRLVSEKKIRRQEKVSPITDNELPFKAPAGWMWARLSTVTRRIQYGFTASAKSNIKDVLLLRITDIQNNSVDWNSVPGCEIPDNDILKYQLERGDILVARTGGTVGKTYLVREVPCITVFASYLIRIQGSSALFDRYLKLFLESPTYWVQLEEGARGGAQPNVNGKTLGKMVMTIPPITEQHRIVAKVDQLMAIVDQLEELQNKKTRIAESFAQTAIAAITGTEIKEQEKMKAPKIELVTKLHVEGKPRPIDKSPLANIIAKHKDWLSAKSLWQQSGLAIDAFYHQLKTEMANGWIVEPEKAFMREVGTN